MVNEQWQLWCQKVESCRQCPLADTRTQVVHDVFCGPVNLFLLGEAPGGDEDQNGHPFTGQAGQILQNFLTVVGLKREEVYISNTVKCRPVKPSVKGRYGNYKNRSPKISEIKQCTLWLKEELACSGAKAVVTLGNIPLREMLGRPAKIGDHHGQPFYSENYACAVFPLYHPAALIYDRSKEADYLQDLAALKSWLSSLI